MKRIAFADIRDFLDKKGHWRHVSQLSDEAASIIAGFEVVTKRIQGEQEDVHKYKLCNKNHALEVLAKHFGLLAPSADDAPAVPTFALPADADLATK